MYTVYSPRQEKTEQIEGAAEATWSLEDQSESKMWNASEIRAQKQQDEEDVDVGWLGRGAE